MTLLSQISVVIWLMPALALAGLGLSLWMLRHTTGERGLPGCGAESGCEAVTRSRWSRWCGIPVAGPASLLYLLLLAACTASAVLPGGRSAAWAAMFLPSAALLLAASAAWFMGLQWLVVRRLCLYCLALHLVGIALAAVVLADPQPWQWMPRTASIAFAASAFAALVLGQVLVKPKMYVVKGHVNVRRPEVVPVALPPASHTAPANPFGASTPLGMGARSVVAVNGQVRLKSGPWPMLGPPDAEVVLVYLFDFTCKSCRQLHGFLVEAMNAAARTRAPWALMLVPVPQNRRCNPNVTKVDPDHAQACAYARLGLTVWQRDWRRYAEFDGYLFEGERPPPLGLSRARAGELLGEALDDPTISDPETDSLIASGIELYTHVGSNRTPTLLMPGSYFAGKISSMKELAQVLDTGLTTGGNAQPETRRAGTVAQAR